MRKFIYLAMFFGCFAFIYLVAFSTQVKAGHIVCPDCYSLCPAGTTCPTLDGNGACNCPGASADCFGTVGVDVICGTGTGEEIFAGNGSDTVCAAGGVDTVHGGFGDDDLDGGSSGDFIFGGWGEDLI